MKKSEKEYKGLSHTHMTQPGSHPLHKAPLPLLPGRFDHLVAIERAGRAADGNYYNARKMNIKHLVDPIDDLFLATQKIPGISSTGKQGALRIQQECVDTHCLFIDYGTHNKIEFYGDHSFLLQRCLFIMVGIDDTDTVT